MKKTQKLFPILIVAVSLFIYSCKKNDSDDSSSNNNNNPCNFTTNVLVVGSSSKNLTVSACSVSGSDYSTTHCVDSTLSEGLTMEFSSSSAPAAGTYTAMNTVPVTAGKVYVEYFETTNAYQPSSGTVTVTDNGASKIYTFCNLTFSNGSVTKTISARATCN